MNCKPGDLAIVIRSRTPANIGRIVQVHRQYSMGDAGFLTLDSAELIWLCETKGSPLEWVSAYHIGTEQSCIGPIPDKCLRPIRRGEQDEENSASSTQSVRAVQPVVA